MATLILKLGLQRESDVYDSIEDSSDVVSSSDDDNDYEGGTKFLPIYIHNSDKQENISDANSITPANKSNVDMNNKGNRTGRVMYQSTGLEYTNVTPSKVAHDDQQGNDTPRLGNMFGLVHMLSPVNKSAANIGNDGSKSTVPKINDETTTNNNNNDTINVKLVKENFGDGKYHSQTEL